MRRRSFLSAAGTAAATIGIPAIARTRPEIRWRLASCFPKSLNTLFGGAELIAKRVVAALRRLDPTGARRARSRAFVSPEAAARDDGRFNSEAPPGAAQRPINPARNKPIQLATARL